jgi:hypothetical protein
VIRKYKIKKEFFKVF